jgi:hypothetical protein
VPAEGGRIGVPGNGPPLPEKNRLKPWKTQRFCIPERDHARFVAHMEKILDVYCENYDEAHPLICMDEAAKQITSDVEPALPMSPGRPRREDHHYQRQGVRAVFLFFDPLRGRRRVSSREGRTRWDWAEEVRQLLEEDYPQAQRVTLVCDNLNTHDIASLYLAFDAPTAHRLARRLRLEHTPRKGSWLNMAEMELSVLTRQCIGRRFRSAEQMEAAMAAWQGDRNQAGLGAQWRFTTADARIKLRHLYPNHDI